MTTDPAWPVLRSVVRQWTGISLGERNAAASLRALRRVSARFRAESPTRFLAGLTDGDAAGRDELIDEITIGATWFLRERDGLERMVRDCVAHAEATGVRTVRVWSAGCATGQESYSIAMLLLEAGLRPNVLGTDINRAFLRTASEGRYHARDLRTLPDDLAGRYFERDGAGARVAPALRACVAFARHNLSRDPAPRSDRSRFDVVVCRNVLIYFDAWDAVTISRTLAAACRPGGRLVLGAAEQPLIELTSPNFTPTPGTRYVPGTYLVPGVPDAPAPGPVPVAVPDRAPPATSAATPDLAPVLDAILRGAPDAADRADQLAADHPLSPQANLLCGLALKRAGRLRAAIASFRSAAFLDARAWMAPYQLGLCLQELCDQGGAALAYRQAMAALAAGGPSGLPEHGDAHDAVARTVADSCWQRLRALAGVSS